MGNAADANARGVGFPAGSSGPFNVVIACAQLNAFTSGRSRVLNINPANAHNSDQDIFANGEGALSVAANDNTKGSNLIEARIERTHGSRRKTIIGSTDSGINLNDISQA
jgi:hypothetical protein